ncbi:MAG: methylenetetrahydrofolate reductase [Candidatus Poseidoniia archaeon]|jgi:methylenetetrahydrofolate reductase (NADPH)|nr:methylenetetrahydrofolate reductase [Candidatus Poseidoniia archaeon]
MNTSKPSAAVGKRIQEDLENAYMEIIPIPGIEERLGALQPNSHVAVTCSPTKGVDETIELSEKLIAQGFQVIPHISAKCVSGEKHLETIVKRLDALSIESIFVPGGDRPEPIGEFNNAYDLLKALQKSGHNIKNIGIAAHPEGHPDVNEKILMEALEKKKDLADYIVTQMCFDANILGDWLVRINQQGVHLPVWVGLPGAIERGRLLRTSLRIGVGNSLRFLRKKSQVAAELMKSSIYNPDKLVTSISEYKDIANTNLAGYHIFCFNQIEITEKWRTETISKLM